MPSHAYFYAGSDNPFTGPDEVDLSDTPANRSKRARIMDEVAREFGCEVGCHYDDFGGSHMLAGGLELGIFARYVHVRLPWVSLAEAEERAIVPALHRLERVLGDQVGFEAFEHGCQGLHVAGDIDLVPDYLAGTRERLRTMFGVR